jgi:hypothetical protein
LKRPIPQITTPSPTSKKHTDKRLKDYASPLRPGPIKLATTPLRNVTTFDQINNFTQQHSKEGLEIPISRPTSPVIFATPKGNKRELVNLRSPVVGISPKANPTTLQSPIGLSPLAPQYKKGLASKPKTFQAPAPSSASKKPTMDQMNQAFEEWMRIAADNVNILEIIFICRKSTRKILGILH